MYSKITIVTHNISGEFYMNRCVIYKRTSEYNLLKYEQVIYVPSIRKVIWRWIKKERERLFARFEGGGEFELFDLLEKEYQELVKQNPEDMKLLRRYGYLFECKGLDLLKKAEKVYEKGLFKTDKDDEPRVDGQLMQVRNAW